MHLRKLLGSLGFLVAAIAGSAHALPGAKHKPSKGATTSPLHPSPGAKPPSKSKSKPSKGPSRNPLPVPKSMEPTTKPTQTLDPKLAKALRKARQLDKARIVGVAGRFNIQAATSDVESTTTLTVRRPYRSPAAFMNFEGARALHTNAPSDGLATIEGGADVRRVRGTGPSTVPAETPEMLARQYDPLHPDFPPSAEATLSGPHLALHFRADANRDYVVSCRVRTDTASADFGVRVAVDEAHAQMIPALAPSRGRVSFAIRRANRARGIDLQLVAARPITGSDGLGIGGVIAGQRLPVPFSVSRCDITPLS